MSNVQFYATKSKDGSPRHVLVATGDVENGKVAVELVGFHPAVEGTARRGKKPNLAEPVPVDELLALDAADVPEELKQKALSQLAPAAGEDSEAN